ncbi:MAG TPA: flagellar basal body rod protein FlgC, partial [Betaproteobacteria bacterium]|nr:flagellar basal body rod protein FlgC [Betaproteobacteria bacterium]
QATRLNATASNMANASNVSSNDEEAYKGKRVVFRTLVEDQMMGNVMRPAGSVTIDRVVDDLAPHPKLYDPGNPMADDEGYVYKSNVEEVSEMVEMLAAARSYQNNVEVINTAKELMSRTLEVAKS